MPCLFESWLFQFQKKNKIATQSSFCFKLKLKLRIYRPGQGHFQIKRQESAVSANRKLIQTVVNIQLNTNQLNVITYKHVSRNWMSFRMLETIYKLNIGQLTLSVGFIGNILRIEQIGNSKIQNHTRFEFMHWHLAFLGCVTQSIGFNVFKK